MTPPLAVSLGAVACQRLQFPVSFRWWNGNMFLRFSCDTLLSGVLGVIPACIGGNRLTPQSRQQTVAIINCYRICQNLISKSILLFYLDSVSSTSCLLLLLLVYGECVVRIAVSPVKPLALISAGCISCSDGQSRIWDLPEDLGKAGKVSSLVCTDFIVSRLTFQVNCL